jgi:hypothetical protein
LRSAGKPPPGAAGGGSPRTQAALFAGQWTSSAPLGDGTTVGGDRADLFADERIDWLLGELGPSCGNR